MAGTSFRQGSHSLDNLADLDVSPKQVERVVRRIGEERCQQRDAFVEAFGRLPLLEKTKAPQGVTPPSLAVVMADGGRLQILNRSAEQQATSQPAEQTPSKDRATGEKNTPDGSGQDAADDTSADTSVPVGTDWPPLVAEPLQEEEGPVSEPGSKGKHWREDKVAVLLAMSSAAGKKDPCGDIPKHFIDPQRVAKLARELKAKTPAAQAQAAGRAAAEDPGSSEDPAGSGQEGPSDEEATWDPPKIKARKVVASRQNWKAFGPMVAAAAWSLGFFGSVRRAFVADGSTSVWGLWRRHFPTLVPIVDFIHALSYVYAAAMAGRSHSEGWPVYVRWIELVWQGKVSLALEELRQRQQEVGKVSAEDKEGSPPEVVQEALTYLENHKGQMKYDEYRRGGLPITSSHVESEIKRINLRVKGTEKFWSEEGAESILQLRADYLSDDKPMDAFWQKRQAEESGQRRYRQRC